MQRTSSVDRRSVPALYSGSQSAGRTRRPRSRRRRAALRRRRRRRLWLGCVAGFCLAAAVCLGFLPVGRGPVENVSPAAVSGKAAGPLTPVFSAGSQSTQAPVVEVLPDLGTTVPDEGLGQAQEPAQETFPSTQTPAQDNRRPAQNTAQEQGSDWNLILVNPWNPLPDGYEVTLTQLSSGHAIDERAYPDLQQMMDDCRAAGLSPLICSSYRTQEKQEQLFANKVNKLIAQGYSKEEAETEAGKSIAVPGTSEHQLGLALDIVDLNNQNLDSSQESTAVQKWLMENSWKYGFILRYPNDKSDVTGIMYEPWHYRYVGREAAQAIYEQGLCLEEYLQSC